MDGNGKIDRYPPLKKLVIKRILCQTRQKFKELQKELKLVFKEKHKKPRLQKAANKKNVSVKVSFNGDPTSKIVQNHSPSNISSTHNSDLLRWRRVKEWFREFSQADYSTRPLNRESSRHFMKIGT